MSAARRFCRERLDEGGIVIMFPHGHFLLRSLISTGKEIIEQLDSHLSSSARDEVIILVG